MISDNYIKLTGFPFHSEVQNESEEHKTKNKQEFNCNQNN